MITARMARDLGLALLLALPTLSLTRPVATDSLGPVANHSPIVANAAIAKMTTDQRRSQLPPTN